MPVNQKKVDEFIGTKRGKLTAVSFSRLVRSQQVWLCRCECGGSREITKYNFVKSSTISCGCWHGMSKHRFSIRNQKGLQKPIYSTWVRIRQRCNNPKNPDYSYYGGRGIKISERWGDFKNFYDDMWSTWKAGLTLERRDNNGGYSPKNCKWATRLEQSNNRRFNHVVTWKGKTQSLSQWARELPFRMTGQNLSHRITGRGWTIERAMTQPPSKPRRHR